MAKRSVQCAITGSKYTYGVDYFNKKVDDYGDVESLKKNFLTKKAITYLSRGFSVAEIRNLLNVDSEGLLDPESPEMEDIVEYHKIKSKSRINRIAKSVNFATHKSDPDVVEYINNIK